MAGTTGLEPATSAVTGQRSNQLSYVPMLQLADAPDSVHPKPTTRTSLSDSSEMLVLLSSVKEQISTPLLSSILVDHPQQLVIHGLSVLGGTGTNRVGRAVSEVVTH